LNLCKSNTCLKRNKFLSPKGVRLRQVLLYNYSRHSKLITSSWTMK
jgi:hypothetical protein